MNVRRPLNLAVGPTRAVFQIVEPIVVRIHPVSVRSSASRFQGRHYGLVRIRKISGGKISVPHPRRAGNLPIYLSIVIAVAIKLSVV